MRVFAFFLPQFHAIPENDEWWGEGFTEWVNIKAAKPLFKDHQIIHPYNTNYYNLLDKNTVEWQTSLLKKYHIDGLIYYHYYFNGKLLLEKPAENLVKWKDIKQSFFFCWANHPWKRTWEGKEDILMPLEYGKKEDWERHFLYLLPFFKDERYEKHDNMPVFMIFKSDFSEKKEMFSYFDKRCKEVGFRGLCLIETYTNIKTIEEKITEQQYVFYRQPDLQINEYNFTHKDIVNRIINKFNRMIKSSNIPVRNGKKLMEKLLKSCSDSEDIINGIWFEWDNTYRHKKRGYIITPYSKQQFFKYMELNKNKEYVFIRK